jgi:hypothetical protein
VETVSEIAACQFGISFDELRVIGPSANLPSFFESIGIIVVVIGIVVLLFFLCQWHGCNLLLDIEAISRSSILVLSRLATGGPGSSCSWRNGFLSFFVI